MYPGETLAVISAADQMSLPQYLRIPATDSTLHVSTFDNVPVRANKGLYLPLP